MLRITSYELATVLSRKVSHALAVSVSTALTEINVQYLTLEDDAEAWTEFRAHTRKNISFFDCANLVTARKLGLKIATFDSFYPKDMVL